MCFASTIRISWGLMPDSQAHRQQVLEATLDQLQDLVVLLRRDDDITVLRLRLLNITDWAASNHALPFSPAECPLHGTAESMLGGRRPIIVLVANLCQVVRLELVDGQRARNRLGKSLAMAMIPFICAFGFALLDPSKKLVDDDHGEIRRRSGRRLRLFPPGHDLVVFIQHGGRSDGLAALAVTPGLRVGTEGNLRGPIWRNQPFACRAVKGFRVMGHVVSSSLPKFTAWARATILETTQLREDMTLVAAEKR